MHELAPTVFIVDDDESVRRSLTRLVRTTGLSAVSFVSGAEFLDAYPADAPGCLLLDVQMPGLTGLDLQEELGRRGISLPIIFLTGHGDVPISVHALKRGAIDFLQKPVDDDVLIEAVRQALDKDLIRRESDRAVGDIRQRFELLTPREREVMECVIAGLLNKQTADQLQIAEKTVKVHRARVMDKIGVRSVAQLVVFASKVGIEPDNSRTTAAP